MKKQYTLKGTVKNSNALVLKVPDEKRWNLNTWPRTENDLDVLVRHLSAGKYDLSNWCSPGNPSKNFILFTYKGFVYPYIVASNVKGGKPNTILAPLEPTLLDSDTCLARNSNLDKFHPRSTLRIAVLGCGSLGSIVVELLARAGLKSIDVIDKEDFESENCSRHILGVSSISESKVSELKQRIEREIPGAFVSGSKACAIDWLSKTDLSEYDFIVDCTGESVVRSFLGGVAANQKLKAKIILAWVEPFCAASHYIFVAPPDVWPKSDPWDKVNLVFWPSNLEVNPCGRGFHPYGVSDVWQAAGFVAEKILASIDANLEASEIVSMVRSSSFIKNVCPEAKITAQFPLFADDVDVIRFSRSYYKTIYDE